MNAIKKQTAGGWMALFTAILAVVSLVVYAVNINGSGYFHNASVYNLTTFCCLAIVALVAAVVLANLTAKGPADKVVSLLIGALQIVAPVLLALCTVNLVAARAEGLGYIYFSNADVILEVQTPANLASATGTIVNMVCLGVTTLLGIVSAFFNLKKSA